MLKLLVCVSILFTFVMADFDLDKQFFDDLTTVGDNNYSQSLLRFKRETDSENVEVEGDSHCCSGDSANPHELKQMKDVKKNCIAKVHAVSDSVQSMRQQMICVAECLAKEFNLLTDDGDLKRDALLNHTRKIIGGNRRKAAVLEEYVDKCLEELRASIELKKNAGSRTEACNPNLSEFHNCIGKKFVQGCPIESQIVSEKCQKIRERLAKGDTSYADQSIKGR